MIFVCFLALGVSQITYAQSVEETWEHHIDAWEARDIERIISDYNEESILILNNKIHKGLDDIKKVFLKLFQIFDNGINRIDPVTIEGRVIFITWYFTPKGSSMEYFGTDTFIVEDSKISVQTIASPLYDSNL